jgi:hypothetical protein
VDALCKSVHIFLLHIKSTVLTACVIIMLIVKGKNIPMFLVCIIHASGPGTCIAFSLLDDGRYDIHVAVVPIPGETKTSRLRTGVPLCP